MKFIKITTERFPEDFPRIGLAIIRSIEDKSLFSEGQFGAFQFWTLAHGWAAATRVLEKSILNTHNQPKKFCTLHTD